jgi:hypothetical protein
VAGHVWRPVPDPTYHGRVRKALTFSNVMSVLAVFIALGGSAVAFRLGRNAVGTSQLKPGAVRSVDIANRQIKAIHADRSLGFDCPARTTYVGGSCIETGTRGADNQAAAEERCFELGRRLPTVAELQLLRFTSGMSVYAGGEWSSDYLTFREIETLWGVLVTPTEPFTRIAPRFTASFRFRCVAPSRT